MSIYKLFSVQKIISLFNSNEMITLIGDKNVLVQTEPSKYYDGIVGNYYEFIDKVIDNFIILLTFDEHLLNKYEKSKFHSFHIGVVWAFPNSWDTNKISDMKKFEISYLTSNKEILEGHKLRLKIWNNLDDITIPKKICKSSHAKNLKDYNSQIVISESIYDKKKIFETSMFSIVVENDRQKNWITEKINDCIMNLTIPIFWGCDNINDFFNINGFIIFKTYEEMIEKINNLTENDYYLRLPYAVENFERLSKMRPDESNFNEDNKYMFRNLIYKHIFVNYELIM